MSPVFRTGGDEFVVVIEGEDYARRDELLSQLIEISEKNIFTDNEIVIAVGMAVSQSNKSFHKTFQAADKQMYLHKSKLKELRPSRSLR